MELHEVFENNYTDDLKLIVPDFDSNLLNANGIEILFYFFPLIERMLVEILALEKYMDIEQKSQGMIRTINSIIENEKLESILYVGMLDKLKEWYGQDGIRNKLLHYDPDIKSVTMKTYEIEDIKEMFVDLCEIYNRELEKFNYSEVTEIKEL